LVARVGVEPTFQRSERRDLPLVDPAINGCPSRNRSQSVSVGETYTLAVNSRQLHH
jgi:hypothetical protein